MLTGWTASATHVDGNKELELICNGFQWADNEDEGRPSFSRSLTTEVTLAKDDYDWLLAIRNGANECEEIIVTLSKGSFSEDYYIKINEIRQWNHDACSVAFTLKTISPYQTIDDNKKKEVNIFTGNVRYTVNPLTGTLVIYDSGSVNRADLEHYYDDPTLDSNPPPSANGWTLKDTLINYDTLDNMPPIPLSGSVVTSYAREEVNDPTEPPGAGWIEESPGLWVRAVSTVETSRIFPIVQFRLEQDVLGDDNTTYDNGVRFSDVVENMFDDLGFQVNSRMFNIGDTTPNGNHDATVYAWTDEYLWTAMMFQKSDIKRPVAGSNATAGTITYEQILGILSDLNAQYQIEDPNTVPVTIRIEHTSYFTSSVGLDLTAAPYANQLLGLNEEESESITVPRFETFEWMEKTDEEFDGKSIVYPSPCSTTDSVDVRQEVLNNNITALRDNDDFSDVGFTLVSTEFYDLQWRILSLTSPLTGEAVINNPMGWPAIHDALYRHGRYYIEGNMNDADTTFESAQEKTKRTVRVTAFSLNQFAAFDPSESVLTPWGTATIGSANYDELTCTLEMELLFS